MGGIISGYNLSPEPMTSHCRNIRTSPSGPWKASKGCEILGGLDIKPPMCAEWVSALATLLLHLSKQGAAQHVAG